MRVWHRIQADLFQHLTLLSGRWHPVLDQNVLLHFVTVRDDLAKYLRAYSRLIFACLHDEGQSELGMSLKLGFCGPATLQE